LEQQSPDILRGRERIIIQEEGDLNNSSLLFLSLSLSSIKPLNHPQPLSPSIRLFGIVFRPTNKPPSLPSINQPPNPTRKKEKGPKREGFIKVVDQKEKEGINIEGKGTTSIGKEQSKGKEIEIEKRGHQGVRW